MGKEEVVVAGVQLRRHLNDEYKMELSQRTEFC